LRERVLGEIGEVGRAQDLADRDHDVTSATPARPRRPARGAASLAANEPGLHVEHPGDAQADERRPEIDEGKAGERETERIDIIGSPSTKEAWKKMYPSRCSGWFIEMRCSELVPSLSSMRTRLS
jgi:hypothetical protein